jgi:hypothetical protein
MIVIPGIAIIASVTIRGPLSAVAITPTKAFGMRVMLGCYRAPWRDRLLTTSVW